MAIPRKKRDFDQSYSGLKEEDVKKWIIKGPMDSDILAKAEKTGKYIATLKSKNYKGEFKVKESLSSSQIRAIFTKIKEIEAKNMNLERKPDFIMLKPLVAYAAGRNDLESLFVFKDKIIDTGVDEVVKAKTEVELIKKFKNFVKLLEAVLAYHKAYGGDDK